MEMKARRPRSHAGAWRSRGNPGELV